MADLTTKSVGLQDGLRALEAMRRQVQGTGPGEVQGANFGTALKQALDQVSQTQQTATTLAKEFQLGNPEVSLEETMIAAQKSNITFQAAVQVRTRMVSIYNEIMSMNV